MATKAQIQIIENYKALMEETKQRISWLNAIIAGKISLPNPAIQEFGFLQLRIMCELIALACLTAHGELPEVRSKRMRDEWNATNILKRLEQLHPEFYPLPVQVTDTGAGRKHMDVIKSGYLTKEELISLYARSSDLVHRGSISKLLLPDPPWPSDTDEIGDWGKKIASLLSDHLIGHHGGASYLICKMQNPNDFNRAQVALAQTMTEDEPQTAPEPLQATILPGLHPSKPWHRYSKK